MTYGNNARVGNKVVFSREGAKKAYASFCKMFVDDGSMEACAICSDAALDMIALGFTPDELESIELEAIA